MRYLLLCTDVTKCKEARKQTYLKLLSKIQGKWWPFFNNSRGESAALYWGKSGDMLPRKNVLDFNPRKWHSVGFRVIRGMENLLSFLKSYPFFKNLSVLGKTVETSLDPRLLITKFDAIISVINTTNSTKR